MKAETIIGQASLVEKPDRHYIGIRVLSPFQGLFAAVTEQWKVLKKYAKSKALEESKRYFLRYYHCDMDEIMEAEICLFCDSPLKGDEIVQVGVLPKGRYASLVYRGNGLRGNQALMKWARDNKFEFDPLDPSKKESYVSRYEAYLTDQKVESRKLLWDVELSIKIKTGH